MLDKTFKLQKRKRYSKDANNLYQLMTSLFVMNQVNEQYTILK